MVFKVCAFLSEVSVMIELEFCSIIEFAVIKLVLPMAMAVKSTHTNVITTNFVFSDSFICLPSLAGRSILRHSVTFDNLPVVFCFYVEYNQIRVKKRGLLNTERRKTWISLKS